ncbi:uncharacterized protein [Antedon mediterranea]|uniref:uncharacterized protein n=1 Tax=Antedon mediterranea TaxID=105859 RepID=UPI003AF70BAE
MTFHLQALNGWIDVQLETSLVQVVKQLEWIEVKQCGSIPDSRDGHSLSSIGSDLYLHGGKNHPDAKKCLPGTFKFDTVNQHWVKCERNGPEPMTLCHDTAVARGNLYVIGGIIHGKASNNIYLFQPSSSTWTLLHTHGEIPTPRCDHRCSAVDSRIYLFGGCHGYQLFLNDLYVLDTDSLVWTKPEVKGEVPCKRGSHSFTAHSDKDLYVFGGLGVVGTSDVILNDLYKLSIDTLKWKQPFFISEPPTNRFNHSAIIYKNHLYVIYGTNEDDDLFDVSVTRLINPSQRKPLKLPPDEVHSLLQKTNKR